MKIGMNMGVLRCGPAEGVLKELAVLALVYDPVRSAMVGSARLQGVAPDRVRLVDVERWLIGVEEADVSVLVDDPSRPDRVESRVVKRRTEQYMRMTEKKSVLRKQLPRKGS